MFVNNYKTKKHNSDEYGLGTWKLDGNNYEELFTIMSYKEWINRPLRMKIEMKGDTLILTFPLNEQFKIARDTIYIEKYLKIKP